MESFSKNDWLAINTIRTLSIDAIEKAKSGHPGLPLGAAPMAYVLWSRHLKADPSQPHWFDRDRFVLSAGHGSMLLYSLLHLTGYDLPMEQIQSFRQWKSLTPGHPEFRLTPGVEATTGPLGQGAANAVGMAMAERRLAHLFNRPNHTVVDHMTYALVSDGDLMEGVAAEAASLAGHLKLGKLIYLYDSNDVTLDGPTSLTFSVEDVGKRYESYGWQVLHVQDGDRDLDGIDRAITEAKAETSKPTLIVVKTTIGFGAPNKQGTSSVHGSPLGKEELLLTKQALDWKHPEPFFVPGEAREHMQAMAERGKKHRAQWDLRFQKYRKECSDLALQWDMAQAGTVPTELDAIVKNLEVKEPVATRQSGGTALNAISPAMPWLFGGDADLSCSTNTYLKNQNAFEGQGGSGANIHFGVREHAMAAIANGMAYHGGVRPYVATFFCFADYMRPAIRLAAMNHLPVIYVWTHDSIGLGEDGPTHQPVEHLMSLRTIPNMTVFRPADGFETKGAWLAALQHTTGPTGLVLTRQKTPHVSASIAGKEVEQLARGAFVLHETTGKSQVAILSTGSEVAIALEVQNLLSAQGIASRVISMPSWECFSKQGPAYQEQVLPKSIRHRVSIEAGVTLGWQKWIGLEGIAIGVDSFGASAPAEVLFKEFGFGASSIAERLTRHLSKL